MRQFTKARLSLDKQQFAAAKVPASISDRIKNLRQSAVTITLSAVLIRVSSATQISSA